MIRTLLIDDEAHVRRTLSSLIAHFCPNVLIVGEADGILSGITAIRRHNPELVLLDIKMKDGSGFDLLRRIDPVDFKVIFITAFEQFAVQAFKFSAIDFILKPVDPEDLVQAIARTERMVQAEMALRLKALEDNLSSPDARNRKIIVKTHDNIYVVNQRDILFCEADKNYTTIHMKAGTSIVSSKLLKDFEDILSGQGFYRIHKSYLVNLSKIERFEKGDGGSVVLSGGRKVPVASRKREQLLELFGKLE